MGTNYYVPDLNDPDAGSNDPLHIGKSSMGWVFTFHEVTVGEAILDSTRAWYKFLARASIVDEYGRTVDRDDLFALIDAKRPGRHGDGRLDDEGQEFVKGEFC